MRSIFLSIAILVTFSLPCEARHWHRHWSYNEHCQGSGCVVLQTSPAPPPPLEPPPQPVAPPVLPAPPTVHLPTVLPSPPPSAPITNYIYEKTIQRPHSTSKHYYMRPCPNCQKGYFVPVSP
jgi:hypothetical protein